jgi:hypothetical protein
MWPVSRAATICAEPRCPNIAVRNGRCKDTSAQAGRGVASVTRCSPVPVDAVRAAACRLGCFTFTTSIRLGSVARS